MEQKEQIQSSSQEKNMLDQLREDMLNRRFRVIKRADPSKRSPEMQKQIDEAKAQMRKK